MKENVFLVVCFLTEAAHLSSLQINIVLFEFTEADLRSNIRVGEFRK